MTRNELRFGVIGTIGNGSELRPLPRKRPTYSWHVTKAAPFAQSGFPDRVEVAIRYNASSACDAANGVNQIERRPILLQEDPDLHN